MRTFTYVFQAAYGSPEVDFTTPTIRSAEVSEDGKRVRLAVEGLQRGHIHHLKMPGIRSKEDSKELLHKDAYYTLNYFAK